LNVSVALRGTQQAFQREEKQRDAGEKQQCPTHAMQDRNDCRQRVPDFQEVQVFWAFFPQLLFFRMETRGSLDGNTRGYNRALTQTGAARQPRPHLKLWLN